MHENLTKYLTCVLFGRIKAPLTIPGPAGSAGAVYAQVVVWAPVGSALAFVVGNDIYYRPEATAPSVRITNTGVQDTIYNGVPDWVYEGK